MKQSTINIRLEEELKKEFEKVCDKLGLSMSTAFNVFAKAVVLQEKIPFELTTQKDPFYSEENMIRLKHSLAQVQRNELSVHELDDTYGKAVY